MLLHCVGLLVHILPELIARSECRQQTGLSDYQSGEDYDASGPLDTRERSFTGNPGVSSTGNTSPTQESSVIGVTVQLGLRLKELKSLQGEHERLAKGQADSNGEFGTALEPLGVKYGRKIGVGGFGAVYEGEFAGKTVAIKVRQIAELMSFRCTVVHMGIVACSIR